MTPKKLIALAIYAALIAYAAIFASPEGAGIVVWIFAAIVVAHLLEFVLVYRMLKSSGGSMANHFAQTMLFGFVHWLPLRRQ